MARFVAFLRFLSSNGSAGRNFNTRYASSCIQMNKNVLVIANHRACCSSDKICIARMFFTRNRDINSNSRGLLKSALLYFLAATGTVVWGFQALETLAAYVYPDDYAAIMGLEDEAEKERRAQRFYAVPDELNDDDYFAELAARQLALSNMLQRLETNPTVLNAFVSSNNTQQGDASGSKEGSAHRVETIDMIPLTDVSSWIQDQTHSSRTFASNIWAPRLYVEGSGRAALATITFERGAGTPWGARRRTAIEDKTRGWVPVGLRIEEIAHPSSAAASNGAAAVASSRGGSSPASGARVFIDVQGPLPHGILYSNLRSNDDTADHAT